MSHLSSNDSPFQSLRSFLSFLSDKGELIRIAREVSPRFELAAVIQSVQQTVNKAVHFQNVEGFNGTIISNLCGSYQNIGFTLSCGPYNIASTWAAKCAKWGVFNYQISSNTAANMIKLSLEDLPTIMVHEKDAGPYITGGIVLVRNPETGKINLSFHRVLITGTDELGIRLNQAGHLFAIQKICEDQRRSLECAILIGNSPLMMLAAATTMPYSESELDLASHLLERPWPLQKCQTVDLAIPENTEIVMEGEILPNLRRNEGPFGEWMGYYTLIAPSHVFKVRGIFGREKPIYHELVSGSNEEMLLSGIPIAGSILKAIRVFVPSVLDVVCSHMLQLCIIKIRKGFDGQERKALLAALGSELNRILFAIVVDEDVDIYSLPDVMWAVSTRCRPDRDIFIIPDIPSFARDPHQRHWGRMGIDATVPISLTNELERNKIPNSGGVRWEDYV